MSSAQEGSRENPTGSEGFGVLVPPDLIGETTRGAAIGPCPATTTQPALLCAATYRALRVEGGIVLAAVGVHQRPATPVALCIVEEPEEPALELRHVATGRARLPAGPFLRAFPLEGARWSGRDSLLVRDATGTHRVDVEDPPPHPSTTPPAESKPKGDFR